MFPELKYSYFSKVSSRIDNLGRTFSWLIPSRRFHVFFPYLVCSEPFKCVQYFVSLILQLTLTVLHKHIIVIALHPVPYLPHICSRIMPCFYFEDPVLFVEILVWVPQQAFVLVAAPPLRLCALLRRQPHRSKQAAFACAKAPHHTHTHSLQSSLSQHDLDAHNMLCKGWMCPKHQLHHSSNSMYNAFAAALACAEGHCTPNGKAGSSVSTEG